MNLHRPLEKEELDAIIDKDGVLDIDISKISGCACKSINECERRCRKYSGCWTVAYANDILVTYENEDL